MTSIVGGQSTPTTIRNDTQTQAHATPREVNPPSETLRANQIRQSYKPPHQLNSPDATHAGSAALLAAQNTTSPTAWTFDGNAGASAAASLARARSKSIEAWKPDKLSSAGAAASLAHRSSISERNTPKEVTSSAATAIRSPPRTSFEHETAPLAISSAEASLTNSTAHAMKAASAAHKPSLTKSPEGTKSSPTHALRAASAAERESSLQKAPSPPPSRTSEEASRINQLARQLAEAELYSTGGISKSDLTRAASLSMAKKQASDKAEQNATLQRRKLVEQEAKEEWTQHQEVEDAARRIVAERLAQVTLTGEEGDEYLAGKAAEDAIHRGDKRVKDWERVLKKLEQENKQDKEKNVGWLRHSMRQSPSEPTRQDPEQIIEAAKRNVKSQLGEMDRSIAQEHLFLGKHTVEQAAKRDAATKELEEKGAADLETRQKQRASTYDIGGIIMTHEQVEAIAQKHVDEVLAEINEKVEREKERLRLIAEEKRAKEEAKAAEKKRKADEKAAQKELKTVTKEQLAIGEGLAQYDAQKDKEAEAARKSHEKQARKELKEAGKDLGAAVGGVMEFDKHREEEDAYRNHMEELHRQRTLEEAEKDQAAAVGGVIQYDHEKDEEAARKEAVERHKANVELKKATAQQAQAAEVVLHPDTALDDDSKRHKFKSWLKDTKDKVARRLSVSKENYESSTTSPVKKESKIDDDEDIYGTQPLASTNWSTADKPEDESAKEAASSTPGQSERPATAESPEKPAVREINDLTAYKSAGYVEPGASEDDHFDDAAEEIDEEPTASSSLAVKGEEGRKMSSERGSRFKEEF